MSGRAMSPEDQDEEDGDLPFPLDFILGRLNAALAQATVAVVRTEAESRVKIDRLEGGKGGGWGRSVNEHEVNAETHGPARANLAS